MENKLNYKKNIFSWIIFIVLLILLVSLQNSFLPLFLPSFCIPNFLWPALFYFFLYKSFSSALFLLIFISLLSSAFLSNSFPNLFLIYISGFITLMFLKKIFLFHSTLIFFILSYIFSFSFYFLIEKSFFLEKLSFWNHIVFYFSKSLITGILSVLQLPLLKRYFPKSEEILNHD